MKPCKDIGCNLKCICARWQPNSTPPYLNIWHGEDENGIHFCNYYIPVGGVHKLDQAVNEVDSDLFNSDNY